MSITAEAIRIDFDQDIEYGQDQAYVSYPTVFPTVTFMLEDTQELIDAAAEVCGYGKDCPYEFMIGINGFTKTRLDNCVQFLVDCEQYSIDLDESLQSEIYNELDKQCQQALGKGCEELLEEAKAQIV